MPAGHLCYQRRCLWVHWCFSEWTCKAAELTRQDVVFLSAHKAQAQPWHSDPFLFSIQRSDWHTPSHSLVLQIRKFLIRLNDWAVAGI